MIQAPPPVTVGAAVWATQPKAAYLWHRDWGINHGVPVDVDEWHAQRLRHYTATAVKQGHRQGDTHDSISREAMQALQTHTQHTRTHQQKQKQKQWGQRLTARLLLPGAAAERDPQPSRIPMTVHKRANADLSQLHGGWHRDRLSAVQG